MRLFTRWSIRQAFALGVLVTVYAPRTSFAQRPEAPWRPTPLRASSPAAMRTALSFSVATSTDSVIIQPTYWLEGGAIGGGLLAIASAVIAVGFCGFESPCTNPAIVAIGGFAGGGVFGFGIGALIGGQFPKHLSPSAAPPPN